MVRFRKQKVVFKKLSEKKYRKWLILGAVLVLALLLTGAGYAKFRHQYNKSHYVSDEQAAAEAEEITEEERQVIEETVVEETGLTDEDEEELRLITESARAEAETSEAEQAEVTLPENKDVYNVLLIGVDRRDDSWSGNSDAMILMSVNKKTKTMHMISFMRDLYADIPGHGIHKLNAACAYGGATLLVETIQKNYGVDIDNYASVDFDSLIDIVDLIGGIELTLSDEEAEMVNSMVRGMCGTRGEDPSSHMLDSGGTYVCDGYQVVAYSRIRYIGNADYQRTERQRTVMTELIEQCRGMSRSEQKTFARNVLPLVTHNIDSSTMMSLMIHFPAILDYDLEKDRVPFDGLFSSRGGLLVPDMGATVDRLREMLYS